MNEAWRNVTLPEIRAEKSWFSPALQREMPTCRWGFRGKPLLLFPPAGGDFLENERMLMLKVLKPLLLRLLYPAVKTREFNRTQLGIVFCVVLASALVAEVIGIHALFGAFLAGTIMPQSGSLRTSLIGKIEDLCSVVLLPIFFAYTGIRTQINLLASGEAWLSCLGVVVLAILGKMVGSAFAARWSGMSWRDSWALGALMNTRGLMELVVLNIGYDLGILSPTIFAIMVVMALVTTTMTGPLLTLILRTKDKT